MRTLARDTLIVLAANALTFAFGLGVQAVLAKSLGIEGRGAYAACVTTFVFTLTLCFTLGQEMANVYFVGSGKMSTSAAFTQSLLIGGVNSVLAVAAGLAVILLPLKLFDKAPHADFRFALVAVAPMILAQFLSRIFLGKGKMGAFAVLAAAPLTFQCIGLLICWPLGPTPRTAVGVFAASQALTALMAGVMLVSREGCRLVRPKLVHLRQCIGYGLRFYAGKLLSMVNVQLGTILLAFTDVTAGTLGVFAAGIAIVTRLWMVPDAIQVAILPRTSASPEGRKEMVAQTARISLSACVVAAAVLAVLLKPIILLVLTEKFLPVIPALLCALPGVALRSVSKILPGYFNGINKPQISSLSILVSLGTSIGLALTLLPRLGLVGLGIAMTCGYTVEVLLMSIAFTLYSKIAVHKLLFVRRSDVALLLSMSRKLLGRPQT